MKEAYVDDFKNVFPNSIPDFENEYNPQGSCAIPSSGYDDKQINCGYDVIKAMYKHILPDPTRSREMKYYETQKGTLWAFDQTQFNANSDENGLNDIGFMYIPSQCKILPNGTGQSCNVHVHFHGCEQSVVDKQ